MTPLSCAGVPNSSAPQAIGTVERPAPRACPNRAPAWTPDELLREFLKATADPANRHLAARQFLTESASDAWDDQGSALLIDKVVFVETRSSDKVSVTMKADILGSLSDLGVFETAEGRLPDPGPIELVQTSGGWRINRLPNGCSSTGSSSRPPQAQHPVLRRPHRQDRRPRPALRGGVRSRPAGHRTGQQADRRPAPEMANTVRNLLAPLVKLVGPVTRADGGKSGSGAATAGPGGTAERHHHRPAQPPTPCRPTDLDDGARRHQGPVRHQLRRRGVGRPVRRRLGCHRRGGDRPRRRRRRDRRCARDPGGSLVVLDGQRATRCPGRSARWATRRRPRCPAAADVVASVVTLRPLAPRTRPRRCGSARRRQSVEGTDGRTLTRPSWALDDAVWVVVDGSTWCG